jgi:predicted RNA-binding Zn ribbon-like protein
MVNDSTQLISDFVNTRHLDLGEVVEEQFATPEGLGSWLSEHGLLAAGEKVGPAELRQADELREALRALLLANNEIETDTQAASATLDRAAERGRVALRFEDCRVELVVGAPGVAGALGRITIAVQQSMADGSWGRLKACRAVDCQWVFEDSTKNHSRAWCSMRSCGNREKARAYRRRHTH